MYGIGNDKELNSNIAFKYRKMGIEAILDVFLMAIYGINSWDNDLIDEEWERYNLNFNTVFKKLSKSEFSRVFKNNVRGYK